MGKKIVDARQEKNGNIRAVRFEGNKEFTPIEKAIEMAENGKVDNAHVVHERDKRYLRTNPDIEKNNNLKDMAES